MIIDCSQCVRRDIACGDCVVGHFLELEAPERIGLGAAEVRALSVLEGAGLVPPLQLLTGS